MQIDIMITLRIDTAKIDTAQIAMVQIDTMQIMVIIHLLLMQTDHKAGEQQCQQ